jgi:TolB-like protein/DNA-binding winged helix-turn-helix (wHTH) protein/Flp pilus assembly protein TadD
VSQTYFGFDEFELDTENCELRRSGRHVRLERIPMQLLILLLENQGKLVRREAIMDRLWGTTVFVEAEHSINTAVNKLRAILRDDSRNPRFIRTVIGQGYSFICPVDVLEPMQVFAGSAATFSSGTRDAFRNLSSIATNGHSIGSSIEAEPPVFDDDADTAEVAASGPAAITIKRPSNSNVWGISGSIGLVIILGVAATWMYWGRRGKVAVEAPAFAVSHSVAVLPFRNLEQTTSDDYLVDGLTDQLTTNLAKSTSLRIISQRSAMQYADAQKPIGEIAKTLNVDSIVEGSYLREGNKVRITAQLLDTRNDRYIWAQTYDEDDKDLLTMQDQVTNDIAEQVAISLGSGFTKSRFRPVNAHALEAYLRGRYFWNERTQASVANSVRYYTDAIREDPNYAAAYGSLAQAYVLLAGYEDRNASDDLWKAQYAAERALELDGDLSEAHTALAAVRAERDWDWAGAEEEYQRALRLNPQDATAHHWYSLHLSRTKRPKEAEAEIQRAIALDPLSLIINTDAAETAYWAREPKEALQRIEGVLALNPGFAEAHLTKGKILEQLHQYEDAEAEYETGKKLGGSGYSDALVAHAMALAGKREDAYLLIRKLEAGRPGNRISGANIAMAYCGLRDTDGAMKWFELAYKQHDEGMSMIGIDPIYDGCRADARFENLLARMRLPSSSQ